MRDEPGGTANVLNEDLFPGNTDAFDRLKRLLTSGQITTFVGSGASVPLYPSWTGLLSEFLGKGRREGLISEEEYASGLREIDADPLDCATVIEGQLSRPIFRAELSRVFREKSECTARHRLIVRLQAKAHITLNYDNGLEVAHVEEKHQYPVSIRSHEKSELVRWQQGDLFTNTSVSILHWHGMASVPDQMVITGQDYLKFYQDSFNEGFIRNLWQNHQLLAIGFGFTDPFLTQYAERVLGLLESDRRHFALIGHKGPVVISSVERKKFLRKYKLDPIFYEIRLSPEGKEDHSDLEILLESLCASNPAQPALNGGGVAISSKTTQPQNRDADALQSASYRLPYSKQHQFVRQVEQSLAKTSLSLERYVWLAADWGMGSDDFVSSILGYDPILSHAVYRLDLSEFSEQNQFSTVMRQEHSFSLETFCRMIANIGESCLILDDIRFSSDPGEAQAKLVQLSGVIGLIIDYCPQVKLILRTRRLPAAMTSPTIQLTALNEADTSSFVHNHPNGGSRFSRQESISVIHKHSGGVPTRLESTINSLRFLSIDDLIESDSDFKPVLPSSIDAPSLIATAISEISSSADPGLKRAYQLLSVLCVFPFGEQFGKLRHFLHNTPMFIEQAEILLNRGLIDVSENSNVSLGSIRDRGNILYVPRMIREYVRNTISSDELSRLDRLSADMYFGVGWINGKPKTGVSYRFDTPQRAPHEISNASAIVLRVLRTAISDRNERIIEGTIVTASNYMNDLISGHYYQSAVSLGLELLRLYPEEKPSNISYLKYQIGRSLRMLGLHDQSKAVMLDLPDIQLTKLVRQSLLLNLALCHQSLGEIEDAKKIARECLLLDSRSQAALHARSIIIELSQAGDDRSRKLDALERECRRKNAVVVANNIALTRAREMRLSQNSETVEATLLRVMSSAKNGEDFYNAIRASIQIARMKLSEGSSVSDLEKSLLIRSYQFIYNERMPALFDQCHDVLWDIFLRSGDTENVLSLFRYSSLVWRVTGDLEKEITYGKTVALLLSQRSTDDIRSLDQKTAYCFVRTRDILKTIENDSRE